MVNLFHAYKNYPFSIPLRVRFFNVFRYFFTIPVLEKILVRFILRGNAFGKRMIPPIYFYPPGSIRTATRDQLHYTLDISNLLDYSIYFCIVKEPSWQNLFNHLRQNFSVLDIGANIGFLTMNMARICSGGSVFAFEPDTENFGRLHRNIQQNDLPNIILTKKALGAKTEQATLYQIYANNSGANRILTGKPDTQYKVEQIEVMMLDDAVEQLKISTIDLMKIDVEGFEIFVLEGARKAIARWKPILFVELAEINLNAHGYTALSLIEYIEAMGYTVKDASTMQPVDRTKANHHTDILCLSK